ncbi:hypothetical protein ACQEVO_30310 [Nocardia sp. CA-290969]
MIGNYWLAVLVGLLIGSAITAAGMYLLGFRRVHRGGKTLAVPALDRRPLAVRWREFRRRIATSELRPLTFRAILALMAVAVIAGLWQNTAFVAEQRRCNDEFQRTIAERAAATADDAVARKENDAAVADLVRGFLAIPIEAPDRREQARILLTRFDDTVTDNQRRQAENERTRAENPYPRC